MAGIINGYIFPIDVLGSRNLHFSNQFSLCGGGKNAGFIAMIVMGPKHIFEPTALNQPGGLGDFIGHEPTIRSPDNFFLSCRTLKREDDQQAKMKSDSSQFGSWTQQTLGQPGT
jgi:hypothetical protein